MLKRLTGQFVEKEGTAFIRGNGVASPEGLLTVAALASYGGMNGLLGTSASHLLLPSDMISLMHVGKSGYRPTATWLMSNSTIGICRLFAVAPPRPLWTVVGE